MSIAKIDNFVCNSLDDIRNTEITVGFVKNHYLIKYLIKSFNKSYTNIESKWEYDDKLQIWHLCQLCIFLIGFNIMYCNIDRVNFHDTGLGLLIFIYDNTFLVDVNKLW